MDIKRVLSYLITILNVYVLNMLNMITYMPLSRREEVTPESKIYLIIIRGRALGFIILEISKNTLQTINKNDNLSGS